MSTEKSSVSANSLTKRPPNAFMLFCQEYRPTLLASHPGSDAAFYARQLSEKWRELPDEERSVYRAQADAAMAAFKQEHPEYKYKQKKATRRTDMILPSLAGSDSLSLLNHMFQTNPFLFQQILSENNEENRANLLRLFSSE
jgi:hypothetical protein